MPNTWTIKIHSDGKATPSSQHAINGDTVNFISDKGPWTVTFDSGSPLPQTSYGAGDNQSQGGTVNGTVGQTYKYTSCCTPEGGTTKNCQDPDIVIDSTPVGGSGHKY
jgi:hypothetical protein